MLGNIHYVWPYFFFFFLSRKRKSSEGAPANSVQNDGAWTDVETRVRWQWTSLFNLHILQFWTVQVCSTTVIVSFLCSAPWVWRWELDQTWVQVFSTMGSQSKKCDFTQCMWVMVQKKIDFLLNFFFSFSCRRRKPWTQLNSAPDTALLFTLLLTWLLCNSRTFLYLAVVILFKQFSVLLYMQRVFTCSPKVFCKMFYFVFETV